FSKSPRGCQREDENEGHPPCSAPPQGSSRRCGSSRGLRTGTHLEDRPVTASPQAARQVDRQQAVEYQRLQPLPVVEAHFSQRPALALPDPPEKQPHAMARRRGEPTPIEDQQRARTRRLRL